MGKMSAVDEFYQYYKANEVHEFKIGNYITGSRGMIFCASRDKKKFDKKFKIQIEELSKYFSKQNRKQFKNAINLYDKFLKMKIEKEEANDSSASYAWNIWSEEEQKEDIVKVLKNLFENKDLKAENKIQSLKAKLKELNTKRDAILKKTTIQFGFFEITLSYEHEVDSAWAKYKKSLLSTVQKQFGKKASLNLEEWILKQKIKNMEEFLEMTKERIPLEEQN